ncbi:MAG: protein kinase, partial [Candidatus Didemnitutus sp.]|nr:protein kinase [Candidatus Didemnitutus sp.]
TQFCDDHSLPMADRLELFARVCVALQHAHQKGIIHRDLKPSNILVAQHAGVPSPKVIDFGIAKATQGRLSEQALLTGLDQFIGTPAYMSPEQAELRDLDIDTRSDVYSLGVLLYELLTGRPPYDPQSLVRAGIQEIRRIIREVEPPRPSTRVLTLADADRATVARLRSAAPGQLTSVLQGDLDWIVMRCLEKDRSRRYGTAHELADDVRRHLRQEPVVARPPTRLYRAQRFVARNRLACASTVAIALALILGTIISVHQALRATKAEQVARTERDTARNAERAEALARADAQRRQEQAEDLLTFMLGDFRTELKKIGRLQLLDNVGEKALAHFAALNPRDLTDTALARQAKALTQIGETRMDQARFAEATTAFTTAYDRAAALAARHPQDGDMLFERAQAEFWLGFVARRRGEFSTARDWLARYRDTALELVALEGETWRARQELNSGHHNLAVLDFDGGNLTAARDGFRAERIVVEAMLAARPDDIDLLSRLADIASWLGSVAERDGQYAEASARFAEMSVRYRELSALEPAVARWQLELARSATFAGNIAGLQGRRDEARAAYLLAGARFDPLVAQDPKNRLWLVGALNLQLQQAALQLAGESPTAVATLLEQLTEQLADLVAAEPSSRGFNRLLAAAWRLEGRRRFIAGLADADRAVAQALTLGETLIANDRADRWDFSDYAQACLLAGRIAFASDRLDEARGHWTRAVAVLAPHMKDSNDWRILDPGAQAFELLGQRDAARGPATRLRNFGYQSLDPLAASTLDAACSPVTSTHK